MLITFLDERCFLRSASRGKLTAVPVRQAFEPGLMATASRSTHSKQRSTVNFKAVIGVHYAYYNFVKTHKTIRTAPAVAAGVTYSLWTGADLVEMVGE